MPPGIPVATVGLDAARNAGILASQILAVGNKNIAEKVKDFKSKLEEKIIKANQELSKVKFEYKTN